MRTAREMKGAKVRSHKNRRIGKVLTVVLAPDEARVVGYLVARPDLLFMFKRPDRFLAYDGFSVVEGEMQAHAGDGVWDASAANRLKIDLDRSIIWNAMPAFTRAGRELGRVVDLSFDERDGKLFDVTLSDGATATALVGRRQIPAKMVVSASARGIVLDDAAVGVGSTGGAAGAAGKAAAVAGKRVVDTAAATAEFTGAAVAATRQRTRGMFGGFMSEFKDAMKDDAPKK